MGVPAFFSWLVGKYPSIAVSAIEQRQRVNGVDVPADASRPNPNFKEFDNLYLDMNGFIHSENEMFLAIFDHIDRLFSIVRPRKLLYMSIDGVAPRAKMNQQRSRRFRSTKENSEKQEEILSVRKDLESMGITLPPPKKHFNSNCITPGTPFMIRLSASLRQFVHMRIANDPAWQNIVVILSDASVPGEGEHKIMEFIRRQRASPIYNPNIVHCICGVDADLIMLGLASHEINLNILREDFSQQRPVKCEICDQIGHTFKSCDFSKNSNDTTQYRCKYIFVRLDILRNYLERDFRMLQLPYEFDLERAIDDWVFLCFFVGNDFLPHLPSLDIYEGAINRLICIYKQVSYQTNGWITENGNVKLDRVELIMKELGQVESEIFLVRHENEIALLKQPSLILPLRNVNRVDNIRVEERKFILMKGDENEVQKEGDTIRLWENGWKNRYYKRNFEVSESDVQFRRKVALAYTEGLCWIFKYYCQGCPSWDWYYPYHYAPFASDFDTISQLKLDWTKPTRPFRPLEQLMGVFPSASKMYVPEGWRDLMTLPNSPIFKFYPTEFKVDMHGTKFESQGVTLLPFVDETLLLQTLESHYDKLTEEEKMRNNFGYDYLFVGKRHILFKLLLNIYEKGKQNSVERWIPIDFCPGKLLAGKVAFSLQRQEAPSESIPVNDSVMLAYKNF